MQIIEKTSSGIPVGTIIHHVSVADKSGWIKCDGRTFNAATYPELNTYLGGNTVPSLHRRFLRGEANDGIIGFVGEDSQTGSPRNPFVLGAAGSHSHGGVESGNNYAANDDTFRGLDGNAGNTEPTDYNGEHSHTMDGWDTETVPDHKYLAVFIKT